MFGYATNETEELMPLTVVLAHGLNRKLAECRRDGTMPWLRPDSKTQVTVEYRFENGAAIPLRVHTIVISAQHDPDITLDEQRRQLREKIINVKWSAHFVQQIMEIYSFLVWIPEKLSALIGCNPVQFFHKYTDHPSGTVFQIVVMTKLIYISLLQTVVPAHYLNEDTIYHLQPSGRFVTGGPQGDAGLTGRKIIVDTYGGWGAHGGGAFSGKDFSKVQYTICHHCLE